MPAATSEVMPKTLSSAVEVKTKSAAGKPLISLRKKFPFILTPHLEDIYFNPHWQAAHNHTIKRAQELGLIKTDRDLFIYNASKFTELCAIWYPLASFEVLAVITDYFYFLWTYDDRIDEVAKESWSQVMAIHEKLVDQLCHLNPFESLLEDEDVHVQYMKLILRDLNKCCSTAFPGDRIKDGQLHPLAIRFHKSHMDYLIKGNLANTKYWIDNKEKITLDEYLPMRLYDSSIFQCEVLFELAVGVCLSDQLLADKDMQHALVVHNRLISIVNDLTSYEKEVFETANPNNAVYVAMRSLNQNLEQSVDILVDICQKDWDDICEILERRAGTWPDAKVEQFVKLLKETTVYASVWHIHSRRYHSTTSPFAELRL